MKTYMRSAFLLGAGLLSSCAANRTAADLAGQTVAEITAYEQAVNNKINAEKGFYAKQAAILRGVEGEVPLPKDVSNEAAKARLEASSGMSLLDLQGSERTSVSELEKFSAAKAAAEDEVKKIKDKILDADADLVLADQALIQVRTGSKEQIKEALKVQREAKENAEKLAQTLADKHEEMELAQKNWMLEKENLDNIKKLIEIAQKAPDKKLPVVATKAEDENGRTVRSSLAYLRIAHASNRDAYVLVDSLLTSGTPAARSSLMDYLTDGIAEDSKAIEISTANRQRLESEVVKNLAKLEGGKQNLKKAREALVELKKDKTTLDHLKNVLKFGKAAREEIKKKDEAASATTPASTNS